MVDMDILPSASKTSPSTSPGVTLPKCITIPQQHLTKAAARRLSPATVTVPSLAAPPRRRQLQGCTPHHPCLQLHRLQYLNLLIPARWSSGSLHADI